MINSGVLTLENGLFAGSTNRADIDLIIKAKSGDKEAFSDLYNTYFEKIYVFVFYRVSHKEVAEDLTEDIFLKAYQQLKNLTATEAFQGWLYKIARNRIIDYYRSKKESVALEGLENSLSYEQALVDVIELEAQQKIFLQLLNELGPEQQSVIKMKFIEELDNDAIAASLGKTEGAIRVIQHRAITKLKALFTKQHGKSDS